MLKCVKCGTSDDLVQYKYTMYYYVPSSAKKVIPGQETREISKSKNVPTCSKCFSKFTEWDSKNSKVRKSKKIAFFSFLLTAISILIAIGSQEFWPIAVIFGLITCYLIAYRIIFEKKNAELDYNPHKYLMFGMNNKFLIKPENSDQWIDYKIWVMESQIDNEIIPIERFKPTEKHQNIIEELIFNLLHNNKGSAFSTKAIINRIKTEVMSLDDSIKIKWIINETIIEWILDSMVSHKKIKFNQRSDDCYYFID